MNKTMKTLSLFLSLLLIQACSSSLMTKSVPGEVAAPEEDMATIVFMRSSFVASAIGMHLFEVVDGELSFVGALPNGNKIAHKTTPGRKVYMSHGTAADFMIADVEAGKTYYSILRPNWGTGGFAPTPIRSDGTTSYNMQLSEFSSWKDGTNLIEKKPEADKWFLENKEKFNRIYENYWQRFQNKSDSQKEQRTLFPSDGI